ncbi:MULTISPECIES: ribonuclease D [unclassified Acinetobacter]|uniref:ribonuclease D n=1 Tax=unclassified Acinetobacter TaxID=196816 RepID=UPI0035B6E816
MPNLKHEYIFRSNDVLALSQRLNENSIIAVDTEFCRRHTYYQHLGLLQINLDGDVFLLDGRLDLTVLWQKIFQIKQNIFHSCAEDVSLIHAYAKQQPLNNLFDTQIALAYLGYGTQIGYQSAVEQILDTYIDKEQNCSDWLARPLTPAQKQYAVNDVYYLSIMAAEIKSILQQKGVYDHCLEDAQSLSKEVIYNGSAQSYFVDLAHNKLNRRQLMQLKQLCYWREELAMNQDRVRSSILNEQQMRNLVEHAPRTSWQLFAQDYEIKPQTLRHYSEQILALLNDLPAEADWPSLVRIRNTAVLNEQRELLLDKIDDVAEHLDIASDALIRKKWLSAIMHEALNRHEQYQDDYNQLPDYLLGWRKDVITEPLIEMVMQFYRENQNMDWREIKSRNKATK